MNNTFQKINELIAIESENLTEFNDVYEYEKCLLHIERIIDSSIILFKNSLYQQSIFLTITAFEETTKAEICLYRGLSKNKQTVKRNKDGLFNHKIKHITVANDITFNYLKTEKIYGKEKIQEILENLKSGKFIEIRENSLYFKNIGGKCVISDEFINEENSKLLLMICIEVFEDRLFGAYERTDIITDRVLEKLLKF
jgi:AbiV family abortive infection protein